MQGLRDLLGPAALRQGPEAHRRRQLDAEDADAHAAPRHRPSEAEQDELPGHGALDRVDARGGPRRRLARFIFISTGGAIYGEGDGRTCLSTRSAPIAPLSAYGQSKFAAEGYLSLYRAPLRAVRRQPAARQRLRAPPGPARRGRRDRDLLRQARPADGRPCLATAARPATTYMWATWSARRLTRPSRDVSGADQRRHRESRPTCWTSPTCSPSSAAARLRARVRARRATGEVQRIALDAGRAERELGWRPQTSSRTACA